MVVSLAASWFCHWSCDPEAYEGGPIGLVQNGDKISINAETREMTWHVSAEEIAARQAAWVKPQPNYRYGALAKFAKLTHWCGKRRGN